MSGHQTATIEDTVYFYFAANDTSGSGGDGATPLFDVREAGAAAGAIPLLSGTPTLLTHANYPAGCYEVAVAATAGNGFAANDTFGVFCTLAIDAQNPSGFVGSCTLTPVEDSVWNAILTGATYNIPDSAGRRIRDLQEFGVYEGGAVWLDTINGSPGTTDFESGTAFNAVDTIADTNTLLASRSLVRIQVAPGSSFTFVASQLGQLFKGLGWTIALGGQDINNTAIMGAQVSGIATAATLMEFGGCIINTASFQKARCVDCSFTGTLTQTLAGDYRYVNCQSGVAGPSGPTFTKTAGQAITAEFRRWSGSITISGLESGDVITVGGADMGTITLNGADAQVEIRGTYKNLVNNLTGAPTVNDTAVAGPMRGTDNAALASVATEVRLAELDAANMPADLDTVLTRLPAALVGGRMDSDVGNMQADTLTASALATDAVNEIRDAILPTQNVAFDNIEFLFVSSSDHVTPVTGATGTSVTRSIDGGAFGAGTGTLAEVSNGIYQYDASAADMNGGVITFRFVATGGTPDAPDDAFLTMVTGGGV